MGNGSRESCCVDDDEANTKAEKLVNQILNEGKDVPVDDTPMLLPPYYDHTLVTKGQEYFATNFFNMMVVGLTGLVSLLSVPTILRVLIDTKRSSTPPKAYKRYLDTVYHMIDWYQSDLRNPNSKGRKSAMNVRRMHRNVNANFGRISQRDLAVTQFGFVGFAFLKFKLLGLPKDGLEGVVHFWRVIGHLMGIQERFNLFRGCSKCSTIACQKIRDRILVPGLEQPPEQSIEMTEAMLKGMWPIMPVINPKTYRELVRRLCDLPPAQLPFFPQLLLNFQLFVHKILGIQFLSSILLPYFNFQLWLSLFCQKNAPFLAFIAFNDYWT